MQQRVSEISVQDAERLLADGKIVLIDVREDHEYRRRRVPGAVHIPLAELPGLMWKLPRDGKLAVICEHGERSLVAAHYLSARGFGDVASVAGGTSAWARSGRPVAKD